MRKMGKTLLAAALVLLSAATGRAAEVGAAQPPVDSTPLVTMVPAATAGGCGCSYCGEGGHDGDCWQRLLDWLTYCPPRTPCHGGCCGCCGKGCTPCCTPLYMYFLDRCTCTLGYRGPARCGCPCPNAQPPGGTIYSPPTSAAGTPYPSSANSADVQQR